MKELDELKEKCVQAMKDVDAFVDEHYEELIEEMKSQHNIPYYWEARIVSKCGVVYGCFRQSDKDEWAIVIYNNGEWL
jgi:hypothetical protein